MPRPNSHSPLKPRVENKTPWYRIQNAKDEDEAEVFIYDAIGGWWGVEASQFVKDLSNVTASKITLRVNSPGGDVYDALAIMNALKRHDAHVTVTVDGIAASAASFLIQAADDIQMGKGAELMIHDALTIAIGNASDFREAADLLDRVSNTIASVYADRAGGTTEDWRERMTAETWYSAEEAVSAGLADSVVGSESSEKEAEELKNHLDLSIFAYAGRRNAPAPAPTNATPPRRDIQAHLNDALAVAAQWNTEQGETVTPAQPTTMEGADMSDKLTQGVCQRLGIKDSESVTDEAILATLDEVLNEQVQEPATPTAASGTVVLDEAQYSALVNDAAAGREARNQQLTDDRNRIVNDAVTSGRIPPARREHWIKALKADPDAAKTLNSLAPGLIPVEARGFTGGVDEAADEDRVFNKYWGDGSAKEGE